MPLGTPCTEMLGSCLGSGGGGTLDVSHYPHPRMVPMQVTPWAQTAYREVPSPCPETGESLETKGQE